MSNTTVTYPATPKNVDEQIIQPTAAFKQEVTKVLSAILFFMVVYLALMTTAIALAILCGYGGIMLVAAFPRFITLMIGIGLVGLGVMVIYFLLKFLFKRNKTDRSHLVEITEKEQPELFNFIRTITSETQSPFPKKIYLSADVNACVFYDSSFWSMFFPIRKNLQIGLGLVNAVNLSEFKAILAHEFGHFSQRSMKLGSYVYNVNKVIYNMLYDNEGYGQTLEGWANISGYFAFFAGITIKIVQGIQWILQQVYAIINKSYMSLSRQMEFHADAVAAYVSGADHLVTSLRRLEVADLCYNKLFDHYNTWYKLNLKPDNIYPQHTEVMHHFAQDHELPLLHGLPHVTAKSFAHTNRTRVMIKNQWASHPSTDDREDHLNKLNIHTEAVYTSAWILFKDSEALQQQITEKIYSTVAFKQTPEKLDITSFRDHYRAETSKYVFNKRYKGFFNSRNITPVDLTTIEKDFSVEDGRNLEEILNESTVNLTYAVEGLKSDIHTLEMIVQGTLPVKTFEFDGQKHTAEEANALITALKEEQEQAESTLEKTDKRLIAYFIRQAAKHGCREKIMEDYAKMFSVIKESDEDIKHYVDLRTIINPIFYENMTLEKVSTILNQVKLHEVPVKNRIKKLLEDQSCSSFYTEEDRKKLEEYSSKDLVYFSQSNFLDSQIALFNEATYLYQSIAFDRSFSVKKELLDWQLTLVD